MSILNRLDQEVEVAVNVHPRVKRKNQREHHPAVSLSTITVSTKKQRGSGTVSQPDAQRLPTVHGIALQRTKSTLTIQPGCMVKGIGAE